MRIIVVGSCGCGKTYTGKKISKNFGIPFTDLDDLYWLPNWIVQDRDKFISGIKETASKPSWVIAGSQFSLRELTWPKADYVIWIDLPLPLLLYRVIKRSIKNIITKQPFCNGNYETLGRLFGKYSIVTWTIKRYFSKKQRYGPIFTQGGKYIHLKSKKELNNFLKKLFPKRK